MHNRIWATIAATALALGGLGSGLATPAGADVVEVPMNCRSQAPVIGDQFTSQTLHIDGVAPESVAPGANFTSVNTFEVGSIPSQQSGGTVGSVKDLSYRVPVPANAQYVSASLSGGFNYGSTPPSVQLQGSATTGTVLYRIPGPIPADQDFQVPALSITFKATGSDLSTINVRLGGSSYDEPGFTTTASVTSPITADVPTQCYPLAPNLAWTSTTIVGADHTPPTITVTTPANGAQYPQGASIAANYKCTDNQFGSGVASCTGTLANGALLDTTALGTYSFTVNSTDTAGNAAAPVTNSYSVVPGGNDHTPPTVSITTPPNGAVYQQGAVVNAAYSCADTDSGILTCAGPTASGTPIGTATVGVHQYKVTATDNEGNPHSVAHSYRVVAAPVAQVITSGDVTGQIPVLCDSQFQTAHKTIPVTTNTAPAVAGTGTQFTWAESLGADFVPALQNGTLLKYRWKAPTNGHYVSASLTGTGAQVNGAAIAVKADGALELTIASITDQGSGLSQDAFTPPPFQAVIQVEGAAGSQVRTQLDSFDITTTPLTLPVPQAHHCLGGDAAFNGRTNPFLTTTAVIDRTPPTITISSPTQGRAVDPGDPLTLTYSCSDDIGTTSCTGTKASGSSLTTTVSGVYQVSVTATDAAGNSTTRWATYSVSDPEISIAGGAVDESAGSIDLDVTMSNASASTVSVNYASSDDSAVAPDDYETVGGALTFAPNDPLTKVITVPIVDDSTFEPDESFTVELVGALHADIGQDTATATILDDDVPTLSVDDAEVTEGPGAQLDFAVRLAGNPRAPMVVDYSTTDGSAKAPTRYTATAGTVTFQPGGPLVRHVIVPVVNDTIWNQSNVPDATQRMTLTVNEAAHNQSYTGTGIITDDESRPPTVNVGAVTIREGDANNRIASVPVTLSAVSTSTVQVTLAATGIGGTTAADFTPKASVLLKFAPGVISKNVNVAIKGDVLAEPTEHVDVVLRNVVNAYKGVDHGDVTILDDDQPTAAGVQMAVSDISVFEGGGAKKTNFTFNVVLNRRPTSGPVTVRYTTQAGTAGTADFTARSGTLTFQTTTTSRTVVIALKPDTLDEGDETLQLVLSDPSAGFTITDGVGTATVHDDD